MTEPTLKRQTRLLHVIVAALVSGVLTATVVAVVLISAGVAPPEPTSTARILLNVAVGYLAVSLVVAPVVRSRLVRGGGAATPDEDDVVRRWIAATIVSMAIREGAGLLGLVAGFLLGSPTWAVAFGLTTAAAMGLAWPRVTELEELLLRAGRGD